MFYDFTEKRIVITGITGGITKATTQLLSSLGAEVIVTARSHEKLWNRPIDPVPQRKSLRTHTLSIQSRDICQLSRSYKVFGHPVHPATGISPIFQAS